MKTILKILTNKYVLVLLFFLVWMVFFDTNRLISVYNYRKELSEIRKEREYYLSEIEKTKKTLDLYQTNLRALEIFARETHLLKKDDEVIYLLIKQEK